MPIGAVSYYSKLEVRDMLGLTDRHIARRNLSGLGRGWAGHEKHDGQYILRRRPTYLLLGNVDVTEQPRDPPQATLHSLRQPPYMGAGKGPVCHRTDF